MSTFFASTFLHGLNFQLGAVLLSLGFFSFVEDKFRSRLSLMFDASIGARRDDNDQYRRHREASFMGKCLGILKLFSRIFFFVKSISRKKQFNFQKKIFIPHSNADQHWIWNFYRGPFDVFRSYVWSIWYSSRRLSLDTYHCQMEWSRILLTCCFCSIIYFFIHFLKMEYIYRNKFAKYFQLQFFCISRFRMIWHL